MRNLSGVRRFSVFVPDITIEEARKNEPYVLYVDLPKGSKLLEVIQIDSPLDGLMGVKVGSTTGYAFMLDPTCEEPERTYFTCVFSNHDIPWVPLPASNCEEEAPTTTDDLRCAFVGCTSHNGIPLFHIKVSLVGADYGGFENELVSMGYRLVPGKLYDMADKLKALHLEHGSKEQGA